jgi:hypothetical protein
MAARKSSDVGKGNGRIRFVLFEADGVDGNLSDIAQAFSSALRTQGSGLKALPSTGRRQIDAPDAIDLSPADGDEDLTEDTPQAETRPASPPRKRTVRKVEVLPNVDFNSGSTPLETFVKQKNPLTRLDRYLVIAYWYKNFHSLPEITANHMYTAYRKMGWSNDIPDMGQPFNDLKRAGRGTTNKGAFSINHIGDDVVNKLGQGK